MGLGILLIGVVNIIGYHQGNPGFFMQTKHALIHQLLLRIAVVLHFQEEIPLSENAFIAKCRLLCLLILRKPQVSGYLSRKAGRQGNDSLMVLFQNLIVHPGLIVIALGEAQRHQLHQVVIACIIFRKKHQMIVSGLSLLDKTLLHGTTQIDFRTQNRMNPLLLCLFIKVNDTVHNPMVCKGNGVHPQLLHPGNHLRNLSGAVQQTIAAMYM